MRLGTFFLLLMSFVFAESYMAKVQPIQRYTIKAAVAGAVRFADTQAEGTLVKDRLIVRLDDTVELQERNATIEAVALAEQILQLHEKVLPTQTENLKRQQTYFHRINKLTTASQTQKDNAYNAYVAAFNRVAATKEKILTTRRQLADLRTKLAKLNDTLAKKKITAQGYLFKLMVHEGDYVAPGTPVAVVDDISRAKLVFFVPQEELDGIRSKTIYLDGKKSDYRVSKIWRVADDTYLSSYRVEIEIDAPQTFSKLMKVELK